MIMFLLGIGAWLALRGQPSRPYAAIYLLGAVACHYAESLYVLVLGLYEYREYAVADPFVDARLAELTVGLGSHAFIAVIFARYCRNSPAGAIIGGAGLLALLEYGLHQTNAMLYHGWNPFLTFAAYVIFFLALWPIAVGRITIPTWLNVYLFPLWSLFESETLLQGVLGLWIYPVSLTGDLRADSLVFAIGLATAILAPVITTAVLYLDRGGLIPGLLAVLVLLLLLLLEGALLATGLKVYVNWSVWLTALRLSGVMWLTLVYARWLLRKPTPPPNV